MSAPAATWRRLDPRMLVVGPAWSLVRLAPLVLVLLLTGQGAVYQLWLSVGLAVAVVVGGVLRWRTTRYRISDERVELHSGLLLRQRRSVPRDRIRTVDVTASLLHRAFGLGVVRIRTAGGGMNDLVGLNLDAVAKSEADRLRRELLEGGAPGAPVPGGATAAPVRQEEELARLDWSWLRFAPLTFSSVASIGGIGAALFNLVGDLGLDPRDLAPVAAAADRLSTVPLWIGVLVLSSVLVVVAVVGALVLFAERWFGYRLTRDPAADGGGSLRVRRGLLTRRSLSVAQERLRGAEVVQPLLLRLGGGAQCRALSTGLSGDGQGGALQPPVPWAEAQRVASAALREHTAEITGAALRPHPPAARTRRLTRALVPAALLVAAAFAVTPVPWLGPVSLLLLPAALALGLDRARALGHRLTARHLVTRQGSLVRRTVALQRGGVVGWRFRQSAFQRRAGLVTCEAVTAAGAGGYAVLDVGAADGAALADAATPGLLGAFLLPTGRTP